MARYRRDGPISLSEVAEFFGQASGSVHNIDDLYRGGGVIPVTGPTGGQAGVAHIFVDPDATSDGAVIRIDFGTTGDVTPQTIDVSLGTTDNQGIARAITTAINNHPQFYAEQLLTRNLYASEGSSVFLGYADQSIRLEEGDFAFTPESASGGWNSLEEDYIALPSTRPETGRIMAYYNFGGLGSFINDFLEVVWGITFSRNTGGDVSSLNRRLLVSTDNFDASYAVDVFMYGFFNDQQVFTVSDGRDLNIVESNILRGLQRGGTANVVTVISEEIVPELTGTIIDDSIERAVDIPRVGVTTPGTTNLSNSDFEGTRFLLGSVSSATLTNDSTSYTTGTSLGDGQWSFYTGPASTDTPRGINVYPDNDTVFVRLNSDLFELADLQTTLGLAQLPSTTRQNVVDATMTLNTTTYEIGAILTVSDTDPDVTIILDGTTRSTATAGIIAGNAPITFRGVPIGDINTDIPESGAISFNNFYNASDGRR